MRKRYIATICCLLSLKMVAQSPQLPELQHDLARQRDSAGYISVLGKIATLYIVIDLDSCFYYALKVRDMAIRQHNARGLADADDILSSYYALKTDFDVASVYAYRALKVHEQLGDSARMAKTMGNIYLYYYNMGRAADANTYFYKAFHLAGRLPRGQDSVYGFLLINYVMRFYKDSTHADSVHWALKTARKVVSRYPRSKIIFYVDAYELNDLILKGEGRKAEAAIYQLADKAMRSGMPYVAMDMYGRLDDFPRMGYHADTAKYQEKAYQLGVQTGSIAINLYWLARLYDFYSRKNDAARVAQYSQEIMRLAGEPRYQPNAGSYDYIAFFRKEKTLQSLVRQNRIQQLILDKEEAESINRKLLIIGMLIVFILLMVLMWERYWHYQRLKQQDEALLQGYREMEHIHLTLKENEAFKNKLISLLARDFKGPLVHLTEVAARFRSGTLSKAEMTAWLKQISTTSVGILDLFDNILKWLRLQLQGYTYQPVSGTLLSLVKSATGPLEAEIAQKQLKIAYYIPEGMQVLADEELLKLVNIQLLQIAVTVAMVGSTLMIAAGENPEQVEVRILAETGKDARFVLAGLENWQDNGLALGLVISRDLMKMMHGHIITEGQGQTRLAFGYILP
ncbi:sensor histidine kinase [Chitinophaga flava]|nr:HAMP domain-containing histidine kinase [Chitinophaga flava]